MEPDHIRFGGGATETLLHPLVAVWMVIAIVLILALPRKNAIAAFLLAVFTIPVGQVVVLGGLHFTVLRILILAALARAAGFRASSSRSGLPGGFNAVDRMVVLWTISAMTILSIQWMDMQALIHNLGDFLDALGGYLAVRFLVSDREAIRRTVKVLALICVIQGACMINEQISHLNVFGFIGGFSTGVTIRDGKIRSEGVLGCIPAGVFGGALIPLFLWLWRERKSRMIAFAALAGAVAMVITSNASTSWMAIGAALVGLSFWPLRKRMRLIRWGLGLGLLVLHLVMKAPVWALIARVDLTGSSSSFHRYALVDNCMRHFADWWLLGYKYFNLWGWDMWDLSNQFVAVALTGGLLTLIFYIAIFSRSFGMIGTARKQVTGDREQEWLLWCLGSVLFAHVVAHFGINYGAPMQVGLFSILACASTAAFEARKATIRSTAAPAKVQLAHLVSPEGPREAAEAEVVQNSFPRRVGA
ncbi:MAG TPA: hypothetical protein VN950_15960 [Terriglobales bacterium]|nr:hypothetical protein [Terriglobales bacterium]